MKPVASALHTALRQTEEILASNPGEAARRAEAILKTAPGHPAATLLLASARRRQGAASEAFALLGPLAKADRRNAVVLYELGESLAALGKTAEAIAAFRRALAARPDMAIGWRALADLLFLAGDRRAGDEAYRSYVAAPIGEPLIAEAAAGQARGEAHEAPLRRHLAARPHDVKALAMLAYSLLERSAFAEAAVLLETVLERHPSYVAARHGRALAHLKLNQPAAGVVADLEQVLAAQPDNLEARRMLGAAFMALGDAARAADAFEVALRADPNDPTLLCWYGEQLKYAGRREDAIAAFRRAIAIEPSHGAAWFRLGDFKTYRFTADEESAMRKLSLGDNVKADHRTYLFYALARARADAGDAARAFADYAAGAAIQRAEKPYDAEATAAYTRHSKALFTQAFFGTRGGGCADPDAIFVVGLPRSGSTLVEQILASHTEVEATTELPYLGVIAQRLAASIRTEPYPDLLAGLSPSDREGLGEAYLDAARGLRKLGRPRFIDKLPENFQHVGLIHLILPNARIIDVRRNPMSSGFAVFRQRFGEGRAYSYDLMDIGLYYRDYVDLMTHWDRVLPGRVHRVIYDDLVSNTEMEIRRLLDYCGLTFEPACLNFHESRRAVMTPSAEQVRRPIFTEGVDSWRPYEPWLGPLKDALGPALERWRGDDAPTG